MTRYVIETTKQTDDACFKELRRICDSLGLNLSFTIPADDETQDEEDRKPRRAERYQNR